MKPKTAPASAPKTRLLLTSAPTIVPPLTPIATAFNERPSSSVKFLWLLMPLKYEAFFALFHESNHHNRIHFHTSPTDRVSPYLRSTRTLPPPPPAVPTSVPTPLLLFSLTCPLVARPPPRPPLDLAPIAAALVLVLSHDTVCAAAPPSTTIPMTALALN